METKLPTMATLIEVGPRDGFQFEKQFIPTAVKVEIISCLAAAGLKQIQVTSFVHPDKVPQMADAEALIRRLPEFSDVIYSGLVLNTMGVHRAQQAGLKYIESSISASNTHSIRNTGMPFERALDQAAKMIELAQKQSLHIRAGIQCAFGCVYEGRVSPARILDIVQEYVGAGVDAIAISDTTGMADPVAVKKLLELLSPKIGSIPMILHFHDTRGLGLPNVMAAMQCGISHFDTALAGMGGCPFVPGAAGNIATEDTAHLMTTMGIGTGIDITRVAACSLKVEKLLNKRFPGRIHRLPPQNIVYPWSG